MEWEQFGSNYLVCGEPQEVRSLRLPDEDGRLRRFRVSTFWNLSKPGFTKAPALGRLVKDKNGRVGVIISGRNAGYLKIGKLPVSSHTIFSALNSLSKKARTSLLKGVKLELYEEGNLIFGHEPGE